MEIAATVKAVTGAEVQLWANAYSPGYGTISFGYESLAEMETAMEVQAADPDRLKMIDAARGCFIEDLGATTTTLYRKLA